MREILFRGKRVDNGEWVEGFFLRDRYCNSKKNLIVYQKASDPFSVYTDKCDPETICQYTGFTDKNENKIWENDVVQYDAVAAAVRFGEYGNGSFGFYVDFAEKTNYRKDFSYWAKKVIVIGNIFDDPELIQEVEK